MNWNINGIMEAGFLPKLDSLTKYPSILTYHNLGERGGHIDSLVEDKKFEGKVQITEKIDGTNFRLVTIGNDYLIGKRDSFVFAKNDRIMTEPLTQTVIDHCVDLIDVINNTDEDNDDMILTVIFGEVYGNGVQKGTKQYCGNDKKTNFRVFDIAQFTQEDLDYIFSCELQKISAWREAGMGKFFDTDKLEEFCLKFNLERTPIWIEMDGSDIPTQVEETLNWMEANFTKSKSTVSERGDNDNQLYGRAEGIVVRTPDRSLIRKMRFEDYRKGKLKGWV